MKKRAARIDAAFRRAWREDARATQGGKCAYCGDRLTAKTATADHVEPRKGGGLDRRENIVAACHSCNLTKGHIPKAIFKKKISRPVPGDHVEFWLAWSRRRINRRLEKMAKRLGVTF